MDASEALDHLYDILTDKAADAEAKAEEDGGYDYTQWCESKAREAAFNEAAQKVAKYRNEV